jgi:hypothetical protein
MNLHVVSQKHKSICVASVMRAMTSSLVPSGSRLRVALQVEDESEFWPPACTSQRSSDKA